MKKRYNIMLSDEAKKKLGEMAKKEECSLSAVVDRLILKARGTSWNL